MGARRRLDRPHPVSDYTPMPLAELDLQHAPLASRFRIERALGKGGMGAVYLARELALDRLVALKVLPSEFADDPGLRERFLRETRLAASFSHPNIVPVYSVEEHAGLLAFTMAFVEGETLSERVRRTGPLTAREAVRLMHDVAYALSYAHGRGVVHRDIKPENLMLERATSRALLMDFGVARPSSTTAEARGDGLTRVGEVVGTPEYMSPEQAAGEAVDGRSDLYALALVMWFALTGHTAMGADSAQRVLVRQLTEQLPPIATARPDLPAALCRAIDRCLEKDADARFPDAGALAQALDDAELAAPEIPIPLRLAASELRMLSSLLPLAVLFAVGTLAWNGLDNLDPLTPVVLVFALLAARLGQILADLARLGRLGFSVDDVLRGLRSVVNEAASAREVARLDPETTVMRRSALQTAAVMLLLGVASIAGVFVVRTPQVMGGYAVGGFGVALFFNGIACLAVALTLAARDPRRTPLSERLFRMTWLGAPSAALLRFALRNASTGVATAGTPTSTALGVPSRAVATTAPAAPPDRSLEARVARLEQRLDALTPPARD
jgi:eukaryotic-like serine/threonine-protein kinase